MLKAADASGNELSPDASVQLTDPMNAGRLSKLSRGGLTGSFHDLTARHTAALEFANKGTTMNTQSPIAIVPFGASLTAFFIFTYVLCTLLGVLISPHGLAQMYPMLFPGFTWITWPSFFIGLIWVVVYAWYIAVTFGLIHNFFAPGVGGK